MMVATRDSTWALSGEATTPKAALTQFLTPVTATLTDSSVW